MGTRNECSTIVRKLFAKVKSAYDLVDRFYKRCYNAVFFSCEHMSRLASEQQDRPLNTRERVMRRIHLRMCTWCRRYEFQLEFLRNQFKHYASEYPNKSEGKLPEDAKKRIFKRISDSSKDSL